MDLMKKDPMTLTYQLVDGSEVTVSMEEVRKYCVQGRADLVSAQELWLYMNICKMKKVNPFTREIWMVKYMQNAPAAMIEGIHTKRARARNHSDCKGWEKGCIYATPEGEIQETRHPFIPNGCTLLAGYFEAPIPGWEMPLRHEVALATVLKRKNDGSLTEFWQKEKQPQMLMKVAESQGLSIAFPDAGLDTMIAEEVPPISTEVKEKSADEIYEVKEYKVNDQPQQELPQPESQPLQPQPQPQYQQPPQERPNYFGSLRGLPRDPSELYLSILIGRSIPFRVHLITVGNGQIMITEEHRNLYERMRRSHPDMVGALPKATPEIRGKVIQLIVDRLGMENKRAFDLVAGNFERAIDPPPPPMEDEPPYLTELPPEKSFTGPVASVFNRMRQEVEDAVVLKALNALTLQDWPETSGGMLNLYEAAKKIISKNK